MRARWSARSRWRPSKVSEVAARLSIRALRLVLGHHPRVAAPATLRAVDDERTLLEGDSRQPARGHVNLGTGEHERAQVLVRAPQAAAIEDRLYGKGDHGLRDEASRTRSDSPRELFSLFPCGLRPDQHPVAARLVDGFHDQVLQVFEHIAAVVVERA